MRKPDELSEDTWQALLEHIRGGSQASMFAAFAIDGWWYGQGRLAELLARALLLQGKSLEEMTKTAIELSASRSTPTVILGHKP